jgi:hypothetical protein
MPREISDIKNVSCAYFSALRSRWEARESVGRNESTARWTEACALRGLAVGEIGIGLGLEDIVEAEGTINSSATLGNGSYVLMSVTNSQLSIGRATTKPHHPDRDSP